MLIHFLYDSGMKVLGRPFCAIRTGGVKYYLVTQYDQFKKSFASWVSFSGNTQWVLLTGIGFIISGLFGYWMAQVRLLSVLGFGLALAFILVVRSSVQFLKSSEVILDRIKADRDSYLKDLLREKRRADIISATILDGIILLRGDEVLYLNLIGAKILGLPTDRGISGIKLKADASRLNPAGLKAVQQAMVRAMPVEFNLTLDERKYSYLIQTIPLTGDLVESIGLSSDPIYDQVLDPFSADTLVLAHDVTLIREGQEAKGHFLATISHEIKTPVTSLTLATRLLKKSIDNVSNPIHHPIHQELINTCVENVDRLRGLIDDLLTTSRLDTSDQKLKLQMIDFRKLVRHSVDSFAEQAKAKGVDLTCKLVRGEKMNIKIDATKVNWAMSNLITNGLRHTPKGGKVVVDVKIQQNFILVQVRDTGPGIERSRQKIVFEKFSPYYDLRVARSGGPGAGLAIAKEIIVAHGGTIWVSSQPGLGSEFSFTLPLIK